MYEYRCIKDRVIDGDTVDITIDLGFSVFLHKERVRLLGIDTPELRSKHDDERVRARMAKDRLNQLLPEEFIVRTKLDKKGKYGRVLGTLIVEGRDINQQLVTEGHAVKYGEK